MARTTTKPQTTRAKAPAARKTTATTPTAELTKLMQAFVARYDAAGNGRRMRGWNPPASGPNRAIKGVEKLRDRSRDSVRNDWSGESGIQHWTTNLIGVGITPRLTKIEGAKKDEITRLWDDWSKVCDADGVLNFYGMQTLATRAWLESGEVFVRMRPRRFDSGMEIPFQIQLIEADFVPHFDADTFTGMVSGNRIRSGIELNRIGQRVAYWVYKEHPGDEGGNSFVDPSKLVRVAKSQMLHIFEPKRPGQLRGAPNFAPVLARLRNVLDFDDAVLERQKLANLFAAFIKKPSLGAFDDGVDPLTGQAIETDANGSPMVGLEPGIVHELLPGEEMQFANPPEAGTTYAEFMRSQNLGTAAGQGLPYEIMSGDILNVSDRTLRIVVNEFRRYAEQRQWQIIVPMMCQPVRDYWVDQAVLAGAISISDSDGAKRVEWSPQGWAYIHPVQDVQAKQLEVQSGFRSRSSVISERGDDPEKVDNERSADKKRETELDIAPVPPAQPGQPGQQPGQPNGPQKQDPKQARNEALDNLLASVGRLETLITAVQAHAQASANQPQQPVVIHNHQPPVNVTANVQPTPVEIHNEVNPTPVDVKVDVAAPEVSVTNEVNPTPVDVKVDVAAPEVNVVNDVQPAEVNVQLPDRKTETTVKRDAQGNIVSTTQVERTLQ